MLVLISWSGVAFPANADFVPPIQHAIASRGGHAANKAAAAQEKKAERNIPTPGGPGEPSTAPPGYAPSVPA